MGIRFVRGLFAEADVEKVLALPYTDSIHLDKLIWYFNKFGIHSIK